MECVWWLLSIVDSIPYMFLICRFHKYCNKLCFASKLTIRLLFLRLRKLTIMIDVLPSIICIWCLYIDNMNSIKFKYGTYQVHYCLFLKASTLFCSALDLLIFGSFLTTLLRFLRNFWLTPFIEAYFCLIGFLIPFWWFLWFWFLDEWCLSFDIINGYK